MKNKIGFMQGRLSPIVDGKIQAFPWMYWKYEIEVAGQIEIKLMEWTLDQVHLYENPLMVSRGREEIKSLCRVNGLSIPSITADCFMQAPFWKSSNVDSCENLKEDFLAVINASSALGIKIVVVPLVDNGSVESQKQEDKLVNFLLQTQKIIKDLNIKIAFESDFFPQELLRFISRFKSNTFGINYDTGNSASFGFDPAEEFSAYGHRILNVHIKDRILNGGTVPLGFGAVNFPKVFSLLKSINYNSNLILQTARADDENHADLICDYRKFVKNGFK